MAMIRPETEMKDSGVQWIGDIPNHWNIRPVKALYTLTTGFTPNSKDDSLYDDDGEVWVTISDLKGKEVFDSKQKISKTVAALHKNEIAKKGSLLYSFKLSVGTVAFAGTDLYTNEAIAAFQHKSGESDLHYLKFASSLIIGNANTNIYGASIMNQQLILNAPLPVPPLSEQQAIADYLDETCSKIDAIIAEAKASIEEYKELKQAVIFEAVTKGLDKNVEMKDSGVEWIGLMPYDWQLRKVKTFSTMISKGTTPKDMSNAKTELYSVRYLKSENIKNNQLDEFPEFYITEAVNDELSRSKLTENDILFVIAGASIGKVAIMKSDLLPANTNQANSFIRIKDEFVDSMEYIWLLLQSIIVREVINRYAVQSAQPNISMENLGNIKLPYPSSDKEREDILSFLKVKTENIDSLITEKQSLIEDLEAYKKSLIYEVVTGKRRVV